MMATKVVKSLIIAAVLPGILAVCARADKLQLQAKFSKDVSIQLNDVTITEALDKIGQKAGVKFVLSDEAAWKLPYGQATRLSVALNGPLADSMTEMLNAFFMRYAVGDEEITIYPRPELEHILGRPTTKQLELLKAIYTKTITEYRKSPQNTINEALSKEVAIVPVSAQDTIDSILHQLAGKKMERPRPTDLTFKLDGPVTVAQLLNQVEIDNRNSRVVGNWYISSMDFPEQIPEICVVSIEEFRSEKLDQLVDISYKDQKAVEVIQQIAKRTGMELNIFKKDSSWLEEKISVDMQNITLKQALLNVVTSVDGLIEVRVDGNYIRITGPNREEKILSPEAGKSDIKPKAETYVGKISIPMDGGKYYIEFMLRENDLTEQLKSLRQEKIKEILGQLPQPEPAQQPQSSKEK